MVRSFKLVPFGLESFIEWYLSKRIFYRNILVRKRLNDTDPLLFTHISYVETDSVAGLGTFVDRVINAMDEQEMSNQYEGLRVNDLPAW